MNTIEAFEKDILSQVRFVDGFIPQKTLAKKKQTSAVFCGSGDSLAAAMLAQSFSDYAVTAADPLELSKNSKIAGSKTVYFVSVSGNTIANIRASGLVKDSVAITRNRVSRLAKSCRGVIPLDYPDSGVFTAGSVGFVASALVCISLVRKFRIRNAKRLLLRAKGEAERALVGGRVFFVGDQNSYPVAMYAAAKMYEVAGVDAHYARLEQFFHMEMFCAKKNDTVVIFCDTKDHDMVKRLQGLGLFVYWPVAGTDDPVERVLYHVFVSQHLALGVAKKKRQKDCHFILQEKLRGASSETIY